MCCGERPGPWPRALLYALRTAAVQVSAGIPGWATRRGVWCSRWSAKVCVCNGSLPCLRALTQAPTTAVAGSAEVCTLRQDRAHATRDEASRPTPATKFSQHGSFSGLSAKKFAQHGASSGLSAKKLAQQAQKHQFWGVFSALGEQFRARTHIKPRGANEFAHKTQPRGDIETKDTTAGSDTGQRETAITTAHP